MDSYSLLQVLNGNGFYSIHEVRPRHIFVSFAATSAATANRTKLSQNLVKT
jgi:hypothetical protein